MIAYAVALDGRLAILRADYDVLGHKQRVTRKDGGWASFDVPPETCGSISLFDGVEEREQVRFPLVHYSYCQFDRLTDGSWIVAGYGGDEEISRAGQRIRPDGSCQRFEIGWDIDSLQTDPDGGFWVGYGDIACLTGTGVESGGVVKFSARCEPTWSFNHDARMKRHRVDTAEALNVSREGAYGYIWPGFGLARLDSARTRVWRSRTEYAEAFAASDGRFLLMGGYSYDNLAERQRLVLLDKPSVPNSRRLRRVWTAEVVRPPEEKEQLLVGRGDCLHRVANGQWQRLTIDEAISQIDVSHDKPAVVTRAPPT